MTSKFQFGKLYLVLALALVLNAIAWAGSGQIPAVGNFRDDPTDRIRSDGQFNGFYWWWDNCVISWYNASGMYFLRTSNFQCTPAQPRSIVLDFSNPVSQINSSQCVVSAAVAQSGSLNICGVNYVPDVRVVATKMFTSAALKQGTAVMLILNVEPVFANNTYTNQGAFELDFEQNVPVTGGNTYRTITASPDAVAELYQIQSKGTKVSLGRFRMPFSLRSEERRVGKECRL